MYVYLGNIFFIYYLVLDFLFNNPRPYSPTHFCDFFAIELRPFGTLMLALISKAFAVCVYIRGIDNRVKYIYTPHF